MELYKLDFLGVQLNFLLSYLCNQVIFQVTVGAGSIEWFPVNIKRLTSAQVTVPCPLNDHIHKLGKGWISELFDEFMVQHCAFAKEKKLGQYQASCVNKHCESSCDLLRSIIFIFLIFEILTYKFFVSEDRQSTLMAWTHSMNTQDKKSTSSSCFDISCCNVSLLTF